MRGRPSVVALFATFIQVHCAWVASLPTEKWHGSGLENWTTEALACKEEGRDAVVPPFAKVSVSSLD